MPRMLNRFSLRTRIMFAIGALVAIAMLGGSTPSGSCTGWDILPSLMRTKVAALNVSQELESSLAMQRGLLSYYYIDGDSEWLTQLDRHRLEFENWLKKAREFADSDTEPGLLNEIESKYIRYTNQRERPIELYKAGKREEGYALHKESATPFTL